jgi:hypothetical protein
VIRRGGPQIGANDTCQRGNPRIAVKTKPTNPTAMTTSTRVKADRRRDPGEETKKKASLRMKERPVLRQERFASEAAWGAIPLNTTEFKSHNLDKGLCL